jgi:FAD:protein FMN transferase
MTARMTFPALGTTATVVVTDPVRIEAAAAVVAAEVSACDQACSRFRDDSELSRLNTARGEEVAVSARLVEELVAALRAARLTDGVVDPTIGRALISAGYDRDFPLVPAASTPPTVTLAPVPGWRCLQVDVRSGRARVPAGVLVDLGATAKARCSDRAALVAASATDCGVLVSLGGDLAVAGPPPAGGWKVRVTDDCAGEPGAPGQIVGLRDGGLASSGVTVRAWRRGDAAFHHVIDPRTGQSAAVVWRTVSVAAATCTDANIAATAALVLGQEAPGWLQARRLPARLVAADGGVSLVGGWPGELVP